MPSGTNSKDREEDMNMMSDKHIQFFLAYRSLCPSSWCERWDDQRGKVHMTKWRDGVTDTFIENGNFPVRLDQ